MHLQQGNQTECWRDAMISKDGVAVVVPQSTCGDCPLKENSEECISVVAPLIHGGKNLGIMGIKFPRDLTVDEEETSLLAEVAGDIAFALHDIELERQRNHYAQIVASSSEAMALISREYVYIEANPSYLKLLGHSGEKIAGLSVMEVAGEAAFNETIKPYLERCFSGEEVRFEAPITVPGAATRLTDVIYTPCASADGSDSAAAVYIRDITESEKAKRAAEKEKRELEEQFLQSQKMESVGRLAGGVAHDLNNLLTPIIGYGEMLLSDFSRDDLRRQSVEEIYDAGMRAKDLVRQLLAFSRKQPLDVRLIDLNDVLDAFRKLVRRTLRENIEIYRRIHRQMIRETPLSARLTRP